MSRYFVLSFVFLASVMVLVSSENKTSSLHSTESLPSSTNSLQNSSSNSNRTTRAGVKDLQVSVTQNGGSTEQVVDNQQGQIVKQTVGPEGIHQTVYRNGQKVTDDIVPAITTH